DIFDLLRKHLDEKHEPSPLARLIWELNPAFVFTTNYDRLLESAFAQMHGRAPNVITGTDIAERILSPRETLIKLHGDIMTPNSLILSRRDYYRAMATAISQPMNAWAEFIRRPSLAIGYSLRDPD